ncbi:glycosyltransferase family 2 protein [Anaeromusa acidaminophila]|uniref:glycosyltransferase family 2 protein n=1 Tax=Anaeromusa acidaminophila TaxID=81464 RepID=UPI00035CF647|nr:glycosyltransferase family 2 protein [Anaeromusa acidaminophila]
MQPRLAILILTYNEEKNIGSCMDSAAFADEIVVVDSGSADQTTAIAAEKGGNVVVHPMTEGFAGQRNFALTQTQAEWVLFLDADERLAPEVAAEVRRIMERGDAFAYEILRKNIVFGQPVFHGGHAPDWSLRFYPRAAIRWEGIVHEAAKVTLPVKRLQACMFHHTYQEWERYFFKFNQYTTLLAKKMRDEGKKVSFFDLLLRPLAGFFKFYILKAGWRDGRMGLVLALLHFFYTMTKYLKVYYNAPEERK